MAAFDVPAATQSRGDASGKLHIIVWYPADPGTPVTPLRFAGPPNAPFFDAGSFAAGAPLANGTSFPLIVLSHGTGGAAMQLAWLARVLAAHGFIVAAPNHPGNNGVDRYTAQGFVLWWLRARDLSQTIDAVLADPRFGAHVDRERIAAAGFSLGGYTMMEIAGATTDAQRFTDACAKSADPTCAGPPEFPDLATQATQLLKTDSSFREAFAQSTASYRDPRVKAVFAVAPAVAIAVTPASLEAIDIPVRIEVGTADPIAPGTANAAVYARSIPGARLEWIPNAGHYTFLDECSASGEAALPQYCTDGPGADRAAIHARVATDAVGFFDTVLKMP